MSSPPQKAKLNERRSIPAINVRQESNLVDEAQLSLQRLECLRWVFSIVGAILAYLVVAEVAILVYHPDVKAITEEGSALFFDTNILLPEPVESLLFRLAVITLIPMSLVFYALLSKSRILNAVSGRNTLAVITLLCVSIVGWLMYGGLAAPNLYAKEAGKSPQNNRDLVGISNFDFYFDSLFTGQYMLAYVVVLVPLMAILFFRGIRKYHVDTNKYFRFAISVVGYALVLWVVIATVVMNTVDFPYATENKYDFNAVYYSMTQVYVGVPMLVDGFSNTYGLYPQFLNPLFQLTGLSIFKFSLVMSLLAAFSFVLNFLFLKHFVRNKILLFLGFATVVFFPYFNFKLLTTFDCLFSLYPIRYIIPSVLSCLAALYFVKRSVAVYWATFFISGLLVLWNPEIGLVCYISWVIVNVYNDFYDKQGAVNLNRIVFHFMVGIGVFIVVFHAYKLAIFAFYGSWPDMELLFSTILYFGKYGMGLLPMPLLHPWNLSAIILLLGFLYAGAKWYHKAITPRSTIILLVSLIGVGYFVYFQGRSQNSNFSLSSGFALVLLVLLTDELWENTKHHNNVLLSSFFVIALSLLSFSFFEIILSTNRIVELFYQDDYEAHQSIEQGMLEADRNFILKESVENEKIIVFSPKKYQALFFDGDKRISGFNPGFIDMFLRTDLLKLEQRLLDSSFNVFIEPNSNVYGYLDRCISAVAATYECPAGGSQAMVLLKKRQTKMPAGTYFLRNADTVVHRKYNDDDAGRKMRVNDATGIKPAKLDSVFSVEVLFYSSQQVFRYPTIVGNLQDSNGFSIGKVFGASKYYFGINRKGFTLALPPRVWIYAVMNVHPGYVDVFINGMKAATIGLPVPMINTTRPVCVGNLDAFHNFIGAISEVALHNSALDSAEIGKTWGDIRQELISRR